MELDVLHSVLEIPKPLGQVHLQQVAQQVLEVSSEVGWEPDLWERGGGGRTFQHTCILHIRAQF